MQTRFVQSDDYRAFGRQPTAERITDDLPIEQGQGLPSGSANHCRFADR